MEVSRRHQPRPQGVAGVVADVTDACFAAAKVGTLRRQRHLHSFVLFSRTSIRNHHLLSLCYHFRHVGGIERYTHHLEMCSKRCTGIAWQLWLSLAFRCRKRLVTRVSTDLENRKLSGNLAGLEKLDNFELNCITCHSSFYAVILAMNSNR